MTWETVTNSTGRGRRHLVDYAIRLSVHADKKLAVTISASLLRKLRWKIGDRVHFLRNGEKKLVGLQRTTDIGGFTITQLGGKSSKAARIQHGAFKMALPPDVIKECVNGTPRIFDFGDIVIEDAEDIVAVPMVGPVFVKEG